MAHTHTENIPKTQNNTDDNMDATEDEKRIGGGEIPTSRKYGHRNMGKGNEGQIPCHMDKAG